MTDKYKEKIVEAFRDNAVKSALLIDDEYLPYELMAEKFIRLINKLNDLTIEIDVTGSDALFQQQSRLSVIKEANSLAVKEYMYSQKAQKFVEFFHSKQLICDVENRTDTLDEEKVRKSDLIVLDYHLKAKGEPNPAEYSLNLIEELSRSKHMNMVVVFTREDLKEVWLEIASTLRGTHLCSPEEFFGEKVLLDEWRANETEWKAEWRNVTSKAVETQYLKGEHNFDAIFSDMKDCCDLAELTEPEKEHVEFLLEETVRSYNHNSKMRSEFTVHGESELWLQAGDIFVVLCAKRKKNADGEWVDTKPEGVWDRIEEALIHWYPSFYRVVTSELQNQIEDANLSMEKVLSKGVIEQIAALWGVLRVDVSEREQATRELLTNLLNDLVDKVQSNSKLLSFIKDTADNVDDNLPVYVSSEVNRDKHQNYLKKVVVSASSNIGISADKVDTEFRGQVLHAFNEQLSIEKEIPNYISTGMILKDVSDLSYYLCIAPSCNTVPNQMTGNVSKRMTPHRPMRFIKLADVTSKLLEHLKDAHKSDVIFISDLDKRLALSVYENKDGPTIEQGIVINHDTKLIGQGETKKVRFFVTDMDYKMLQVKEKSLLPVAKLRPAFSSRYQNAQLQYEARIGVDLVSANMK
ncbi:putative Response receiver domain-containing protein [Vibrio crassostreae]|nr:putative Response receiver domain-containing protein [Vibrio crassostreae]CAK2878912.1 putative Response receiver domain-containing protein [Vibrio crassostreae]CAK3491345.1 putative Response receiver domain-containing protein [Vibrio crassostreae]